MPTLPAAWRIAAGRLPQLDAFFAEEQFQAPLVQALRDRLRVDAVSGDGVITPDEGTLDLFTTHERLRWWTVLAGHPTHRAYRWPLALPRHRLAELGATPRFAGAVNRILRWGIADDEHVLFADLFALEGAFGSAAVRDEFFQALLTTETIFAKVTTGGLDPADAAELADYWRAAGRSRDVEGILAAASRIEGHDRVDLAHLVPRLARSLMYTFPPDFRAVGEPSVENAAVAVAFFAPEADTQAALAGGFRTWLAEHCAEVDGPRQFGDIVVFDDPGRTRWPYSMVHIADDLLLGRRPTLFGPWELLTEAQAAALNIRLRDVPVRTFRRIDLPAGEDGAVAAADSPPGASTSPPERVELRDLARGPWGTLRYYEVALSPSSALLESLPPPEARPTWTFRGITINQILSMARDVALPAELRQRIEQLFLNAEVKPDGLITVHPPLDLVFAVPADLRTLLFRYLQHGIESTEYVQSVSFATPEAPDAWFKQGVIPERLRQSVLSLVYRRGQGLVLSDMGALYHLTDDPQERIDLLKYVYASPALIVLLERPAAEAVPGLADYWRLDQQKSTSSLLNSFARNPDVKYLDVVHLLTPVARELMNVFIRAPSGVPTPSCYWTALNFDAERPDARLMITPGLPGPQQDLVLQKLKNDYARVDAPSRLGDLIMYRRRSDGEVRHLCTYIAADIVYTKNGLGTSSPWCLMHQAAVDALYFQPGRVDRLVFRNQSPQTPRR